jgi:hypothetical protein
MSVFGNSDTQRCWEMLFLYPQGTLSVTPASKTPQYLDRFYGSVQIQ